MNAVYVAHFSATAVGYIAGSTTRRTLLGVIVQKAHSSKTLAVLAAIRYVRSFPTNMLLAAYLAAAYALFANRYPTTVLLTVSIEVAHSSTPALVVLANCYPTTCCARSNSL